MWVCKLKISHTGDFLTEVFSKKITSGEVMNKFADELRHDRNLQAFAAADAE